MRAEASFRAELEAGLGASAWESRAPDGAVYAVPSPAEIASSFAEIAAEAERHRARGGQVVVVQGLGFVGSAVCAAVAAARDSSGRPAHFVIGVDLPAPGSYWKIGKLEDGVPPVASPDRELERLVGEGVHEARNLRATASEQAYALADVVVVDVHLGVEDRAVDRPSEIRVELDVLTSALTTVGRGMRPDALVVIESTVPVGTCEHVVLPLLRRERLRRGITAPVLLAHAYERVMPGPRYVDSIRRYPRSFSGVDAASAERARAFISTFVDTESHPLRELADSTSSELGKLLENSYRAANIAFVHEWTLLAEQIGVNLFDVVDSIRDRAGTHDNMRYPGFGVGGYCLTKDSLLAQWGASNLLGSDVVLGTTLAALRTNQLMPLHTVDLVRELAGGDLSGCTVAVAGVSYLPDVADTRDAPAALLVDELGRARAEVRVHDPQVREWAERPEVSVAESLAAAVAGADGIVFAVPHAAYLELGPGELTALAGRPGFAVDAQNIVSDEKAAALRAAGWRLLGVGKGHWRKRGYEARA